MPLDPAFPIDPHVILDPRIRWYPGDAMLAEMGYEMLLPPLVHKLRLAVKEWRDAGYSGASETTRALLRWWFETEHLLPQSDGSVKGFRYYFAQREAVESAIWLYEVERARDPYALLKHDSSGRVSKGMFQEDWTRYVMKMATGSGKTKVMSLLMAWSYFHKLYEPDSELSTNLLVIAPNIIVLDRLRVDFDGCRIFRSDPVLPNNGYEGRNWDDDFQPKLHIQDEVRGVAETGNIFLTNIHRVYESDPAPSLDDDNLFDYFAGRRPTGETNQSRIDLGDIVRDVPDLVVFNDEAHHVHDEKLAWFQCIKDIAYELRMKGSDLSAQFDLTATPKHNNGAIFVQTISDYPLVEAIRQRVVKTPVLPDAASRAKLSRKTSAKYTEEYGDYLHLGYLEWKKAYDELAPSGKKSVMFVMTDDTKNCDEVAEWLEATYPELRDAVLVIHTKNNGEISEASSGKNKTELDRLRKLSREIDEAENKYKAIVSVMVLREGWDVQNVVTIVGLRPYKAKSKILPEQTLGRGLRRMFRGQDVDEKVSVIGTEEFMDFVESIKTEGVELEYQEMGERSRPKSPIVIDVDRDNEAKDIDRLDIELPILEPRIYREYKNLSDLDEAKLGVAKIALKTFSEAEQREIVFRDINTDEQSHTTLMDTEFTPTYQNAIGFFVKMIMRDLRLVGGHDLLFGKMKSFVALHLFDRPVMIDDLNVLRNLSEPEVTRAIYDAFKSGINALTVKDRGTTEIRDYIKMSKARPQVVNDQEYLIPKKSIFNKVVGDRSKLELEFAAFLDDCSDIISFVKIPRTARFSIEYRTADGSIAPYYPDFAVKETFERMWIVETKGREDLDDVEKWERLKSWCTDATKRSAKVTYHPMLVREEAWERYKVKKFSEAIAAFV